MINISSLSNQKNANCFNYSFKMFKSPKKIIKMKIFLLQVKTTRNYYPTLITTFKFNLQPYFFLLFENFAFISIHHFLLLVTLYKLHSIQ